MSKRISFFSDTFLSEIKRLTAATQGFYIKLVLLAHTENGELSAHETDVARNLGIHTNAWRKIRSELLEKKMIVEKNGFLIPIHFTNPELDGVCGGVTHIDTNGDAMGVTGMDTPPVVPLKPAENRESEIPSNSISNSKKEREIDKSISLKKTQKTKRDWKADERFLRFREAYPIRPGDSPGIAYEVFLKLVENEGVDHEKIIDGARRYAASRIGESEKFTKHACHWLSPHYRGWELDWTPAKQAIGGSSPGVQSFGDAFIGSIRALGSSFDGPERDFESMRTVN